MKRQRYTVQVEINGTWRNVSGFPSYPPAFDLLIKLRNLGYAARTVATRVDGEDKLFPYRMLSEDDLGYWKETTGTDEYHQVPTGRTSGCAGLSRLEA